MGGPLDYWLVDGLNEIHLLILIATLFLVPKFVERFQIPSALSCLVIGVVLTFFIPGLAHNTTINLLAVIGICSLFMFAGLEVNVQDLSKNRRAISVHLFVFLSMLLFCIWGLTELAHLEFREAVLYSLALVTPSTGFILDALSNAPLNENQKYWVKSNAISTELIAIALMFVTLQSRSILDLGLGILYLSALILILPMILKFFAKIILPHAPGSEMSFFVILAIVVGYATKAIGAHYLVGAFIVGMSIRRLDTKFEKVELHRLLDAVKLFGAFFVPFYFFRGGSHINMDALSTQAGLLAAVLILIMFPFRMGLVVFERRFIHRETIDQSGPIALSLLPTLIFGLVIADLLYLHFGLRDHFFGALILYTLGMTLLPRFFIAGLSRPPKAPALEGQA